MTGNTKLKFLKVLHTAIWVFFNVVIFYLLYAVLNNKIDKWVWIGLGLIFLEGIVLLVFNRMCPITVMARRFSASKKDNFDIYLPNWLAKYNVRIYSGIVILILFILIYQLL